MRRRTVLICALASAAWVVIAWNIFDPMSTIMFRPVKVPDTAYFTEVDKLNNRFWPLMLEPLAAIWFAGWFVGEGIKRRR